MAKLDLTLLKSNPKKGINLPNSEIEKAIKAVKGIDIPTEEKREFQGVKTRPDTPEQKLEKEVKKIDKVIEKTDRLIAKDIRNKIRNNNSNKISNENRIINRNNEIKQTQYDEMALMIMLEEMQPKEQIIFIDILKELKEETNIYKSIFMNEKLSKKYGITRNGLSTYLDKWKGDIFNIENINPYTFAPSRKFRVISIDKNLKESIDTSIQGVTAQQ
jgi:hypothetical protein